MAISGTSRLACKGPILFTYPDSARRLDGLRRIDRRLTQPASTTTLTLGTCSCTASRWDIYNSCLHGWFGVALSVHPTFFHSQRLETSPTRRQSPRASPLWSNLHFLSGKSPAQSFELHLVWFTLFRHFMSDSRAQCQATTAPLSP
jgi:hypothetical protein